MLPSVYDALCYVRAACRIRVQWRSRALPIILLTAALDFAAASGANGQALTTVNSPMSLTQGTTTIVDSATTINNTALGDVFRAPTLTGSAATTPGQPQAILNIMGATISTGPASGPPMTDSALVVNGGGTTPGGTVTHY
jgi:hypothetical protein